ncbi:MAG TPA: hypothetical protein VMW66_06270 [Elusimicrobiales bacterium]|nr:hypothetical protein [Elusimicrobiales bacterium]
MKLSTGICFFLFVVLCVGCMAHRQQKADWISLGPVFNPVKAETVEVFKSGKKIKRASAVVGVIKSGYIDASNEKAIETEITKIIALAAQHGANAIILRRMDVMEDATYADKKLVETPHIYLYAKALKYVDNLTQEDKNAIEEWEADTYNL